MKGLDALRAISLWDDPPVASGPPPAAPALVQSARTGYLVGNEGGGSVHPTLDLTLLGVTAGNFLSAIVTTGSEQNSHVVNVVSASDNQGNTWNILKITGAVGLGCHCTVTGSDASATVTVDDTAGIGPTGAKTGEICHFAIMNIDRTILSVSAPHSITFDSALGASATIGEHIDSADGAGIIFIYAWNCKGGDTTITVDTAGSIEGFDDCSMVFAEWQGMYADGDPVMDHSRLVGAQDGNLTTTPTSADVTLSHKGTVIVVYSNEAEVAGPYSVATGWNILDENDDHIDLTQYQFDIAAGTASAAVLCNSGVQYHVLGAFAIRQAA